MMILKNVPTLMSPEKAKKLAAQLTAESEDGWKYSVKAASDPNDLLEQITGLKNPRYASVEIFDETGESVGFL